MSIPLPWAIALGAAGAMGVVIVLAIAARRGSLPLRERPLALVALLLGGGLTGFLSLAFPPAWPLLAAVVGMLVAHAWRDQRLLDIGLLLVGFGFAWTLLIGLSIVNAATDPAVYSTGDETGWFAFGAALLVAGIAISVGGARSREPT